MPQLLGAVLRSPRELLAFVGLMVVIVVVTEPLPPVWQLPVALALASIPGTMLMDRVRKRLLSERHERDRERSERERKQDQES